MFLAARAAISAGVAPAATLIGVPYDRTSSFRAGARLAPAAIRWASQSIESYSPTLDRDLEDLALLDRADLTVEYLSPEEMMRAVTGAVAAVEGVPVILGGNHTVTVGAVQGVAARFPDLLVLILDAHLDLRGEYEGSLWSHACTARRLADTLGPDRVAVLGVRSGTREEFTAARALLAAERRLVLPAGLWSRLDGRPLYLSVDIDVVNPADAPGTGNPEPGGPTAEELLDMLRVLAPLRIVGLDVVEVAPPYDPSGRTAILAALILREALLTWAPGP